MEGSLFFHQAVPDFSFFGVSRLLGTALIIRSCNQKEVSSFQRSGLFLPLQHLIFHTFVLFFLSKLYSITLCVFFNYQTLYIIVRILELEVAHLDIHNILLYTSFNQHLGSKVDISCGDLQVANISDLNIYVMTGTHTLPRVSQIPGNTPAMRDWQQCIFHCI